MSEYTVAKFGGTSMAQPELVADILEGRPDHQLVVVSAPGTDASSNVRVTDMLRDYSEVVKADDQAAVRSSRDAIIDRFDSVFNGLGTDARQELRQRANALLTPAHHDDDIYYMHLGETLSAWSFARMMEIQYVTPAVRFAGNGRLDRPKTLDAVRQQTADLRRRAVVPGFFGNDPYGRTWLLGHGGSDRTGALYAAARGWDYENWTDVDGIYSADPRIVDNTHLLSELSREEVREGAHGGTEVLMGETLVDLGSSGVVTTIKNTFNPDAPGTRIVRTREADQSSAIVAVSGRTDLVEISISDMGMANEPGYVDMLLKKFGRLGLSWQHMPTAQDSFSITTVPETAKQAAAVDEFIEFVRSNGLSSQATVEKSDKGVVYAVGERLRDPRVRSLTVMRIIDEILCHAFSVEDTVSNRLSPSLAFLVQPEAVTPIIRAIHHSELERK